MPPSLLKQPQVLFNLGELYFGMGQRRKAIDYYKRLLALEKNSAEKDADTKALIAARLLGEHADIFKSIHNHYTDEEKEEIQEAIQLFTDSWDVIKDTELATTHYYTIMNRGVAYKISGQLNMALVDFQKAYDLSGEFLPFKNLLVLYLDLKDFTNAEGLIGEWEIKKNLSEEELFDISTIKARLYLLEGKTKESIQELQKHLKKENPYYLNVLCLIISNLLEKGLYYDAEPFVNQLKNEYPSLIVSYEFSAALNLKLGKKENGLKELDIAKSMVDGNTPPHEIFEIAALYADVENFEKSMELFDKIANKKKSNALSRGLVYAQYKNGNVSQALSLANTLFKTDPGSPFLAEVIINIYCETGQFDKAASLVENYLPKAPQHLRNFFLLKAATIYNYKREPHHVLTWATQIGDTSDLVMNDAFTLATLFIQNGDPENAIKLAYKTRSKYYDNYEAHEQYIYILNEINTKSETLFPDTVSPDTAIYVSDPENKELIYLITDEPSRDPAIILSTREDMVKKLLGKKIGEEFVIENKYGSILKLRINAILINYIFAYRQTIYLFETRFFGQTKIAVFRTDPDNPLKSLFNAVRQISIDNNEFNKQIYSFYEKRIAPIGVVAGLSKRNIADQWFMITGSKDVFLYAYSANEHLNIRDGLDHNKPLVMDITSLLALFFLYPEHALFEGQSIIVAQATINELLAFSEQLDSYREEGRAAVGFQDGVITGFQISNEDIQKQKLVINNIISWCRSKTSIKRPNKLVELKREEREMRSKLLTPSLFETALLCEEYNGVVISDDDSYKNLLSAEYKLKSFSTFQWAIWLHNEKKIGNELMEEISMKLILANYIFIPASAAIIYKCFEFAKFQIQKPFIVAIKGLQILNAPFVADRVVQFIKQLYLNPGLIVIREHVIMYILSEIKLHNLFIQIKRTMQILIPQEFKFMPTQGNNFLQFLNTF